MVNISSTKKIKILIVRFSSIGDIVLTTPIVRCVKQQIPNCEIHYFTKKHFLELIDKNIYVDKIFILDNNFNEIAKSLKLEEYDYVVDLHRNFRTKLLRIKLSKPKYFSFHKINFKKWFYVNFKINYLPNVHIVDRMFKSVNKIGVEYDGKGLDFFINDNIKIDEEYIKFTNLNNKYFVFAIGGTYFTKRFPKEKIVELCKRLNFPVILIGGKEDVECANYIKNELTNLCLNYCGNINLKQSAFLLQKSSFVISNDTGMMHIASALKKPIVSIWGNTVPEFGMYPFLPNDKNSNYAIFENKNLACRPCSKLGYNKCPKNHFDCMNSIDVEDIKKYIFKNNLI